jgi:hypothetical protein
VPARRTQLNPGKIFAAERNKGDKILAVVVRATAEVLGTGAVQVTAAGSATVVVVLVIVAEPGVAAALVTALERANLAVVEVAGALFKASIVVVARPAAPASAAARAELAVAAAREAAVAVVEEGAEDGDGKRIVSRVED